MTFTLQRVYTFFNIPTGCLPFEVTGLWPPWGSPQGFFYFCGARPMAEAEPKKFNTVFLIDGYNFFYSIKTLDPCVRWFDFKKFCQHFLTTHDLLSNIAYFTTVSERSPESAQRHRILIEAQEHNGIHVTFGEFKPKVHHCPYCDKTYNTPVEKITDVKIALTAYRIASIKDVDKIIIVSGDTDLLPVFAMVKRDFPNKPIGVIFPLKRAPKQLQQIASFYHRTTEKLIYDCQLPDEIELKSGKKLTRPAKWTAAPKFFFVASKL